jgi:DNA-binding Lrp family transcriptional regulator
MASAASRQDPITPPRDTAQQNCAGAMKSLSSLPDAASHHPEHTARQRMRGPKLDRIDRRILDLLQSHGRMTNIELARRVGISPPPCLRRVRALEEAGLIRGYHADLAVEALGFGVTVFAQVGLQSQAETDLRAFETLVAGWPEVREAHMLAGETDFLLKIVASDWDSYQRFLSARLTAAPNVAHVKSALVLRVSKSTPGVPIGGPFADPPRQTAEPPAAKSLAVGRIR